MRLVTITFRTLELHAITIRDADRPLRNLPFVFYVNLFAQFKDFSFNSENYLNQISNG